MAVDRPDPDADAIIVLGGGVIGSIVAWNLQRGGMRTLLIDPVFGVERAGANRPASYGNAGHIATEQTSPLACPKVLRSMPGRFFATGGALDVRLRDMAYWGPWALRYVRASTTMQAKRGQSVLKALLCEALPAWERLCADLGRPDLMSGNGHVVTWSDPRRAASGQRAWLKADVGTATALPLDATTRDLIGQLTKMRPKAGVRFLRTGQVHDIDGLMACVRTAFTAHGGQILTDRAVRLDPGAGGVAVLLESGRRLPPGRVVVASGVGSGTLLHGLGHAAPVVSERGYHIEGEAGPGYSLPPLVIEDRSIIVTRLGSRLRVSSFVEFARELAPPDPRKWERLRRHVRELGLPVIGPLRQWMGARPTLPDYLPAIGESRLAASLFYAFGHQHLGLTLSAVTGEIMAALVSGREPDRISGQALAACRLERFDRRGAVAFPVSTQSR